MRYDLETMVRRANPGMRRKRIELRETAPPAVMATDLFRSCYLPVVQTWTRASVPIMAEYERSLSELTTDSAADIQQIIGTVESELQRLFLELTPKLRDWAFRVEGWVRGKWRGAVLSATGVDVGTLIGPEDARETIETFVARNVGLIKDVSAQAQGRIADAVFRGLNQRKPAREVAAEIREAVAMSRRRSMNIASHQLSDLSNRLADERRREAGLDAWVWVHSGKQNPRPEHVARNGKEYTDETAPTDLPGALPFCGCRSRGVIHFD